MSIFAGSLVVLLSFSALAEAGSLPAAEPDSAAARIQKSVLPAHYLQGHFTGKPIPQAMLEQDIAGVSIAFVDDGEIAWQLSFGYADLAGAMPVTPDTVFGAASLSKPVAAMAALGLVDQGRLDLDDDVNRYLRGWKLPESELTTVEKVTLRRLIGHTAGVKNHLWSAYAMTDPVPTVEEMLAGKEPSVDPPIVIESVPGEKYKYSNPGYAIIQKLVQDASGQDFHAAVDRLVFTPAGMKHSSFAQPLPPGLGSRAAKGYSNDLEPYPARVFPFLAAGGMWTTPTDMARFMAAIMADAAPGRSTIISRQLAAEVFSRSESRLGFGKKLGSGDALLFEHWGSNAGFTSYMVGSPAHKQGLVIMTNSDNGFDLMASIARSVAREYDWDLLEPTAYQEVSLSAGNLPRFTGDFGSEDTSEGMLTFSVDNEVLSVLASGDDSTHGLVPVADTKFISPSRNTTYEFIEGKDGTVRWVRVTRESGYNYDLPRN